jgi:hypothetical protein
MLKLDQLKGRKTYIVCAVIVCLAACQKAFALKVPDEVWIGVFGLGLAALRAAVAEPGRMLALLALGAGLLAGGCGSVKPVDANKWAAAYYEAPNVATLWVIENTNAGQVASFEVKNFTRFEMNTPVPPKSIIPRDPVWYESLFDTLKTVAPWAIFGWMVHDAGGIGETTTINNAAPAP